MGLTKSPRKVAPSSQEVQVVFGGTYIAKTNSPLLIWEDYGPPRYYVPDSSILRQNVHIKPESGRSNSVKTEEYDVKTEVHDLKTEVGSEAADLELTAGSKRTVITVFTGGALDGYVRLKFFEMDAWLEAGALTRLPPKNPAHRVDTAVSSAHIVVIIRDTLFAETRHAIKMFETGLPTRYYLPATSVVDWGLLKESRSKKVTACPYKGEARYFDIEIGGESWEDVVWYYLYPIAETAAIAGKLAFAVGRDGITITADGVELKDSTVMHTISLGGTNLRPQ